MSLGPVYVLTGAAGSGRSARLEGSLQFCRSVGYYSVLVAPFGTEGNGRVVDGGVICGGLARSIGVFQLLSVLMESHPGRLVIGVDDAEHLPDNRRLWTGLLSMAKATGNTLLVVVPDFGTGLEAGGGAVRQAARSFPALPFDGFLIGIAGGGWQEPVSGSC